MDQVPSGESRQVAAWRGDFGDSYIERNQVTPEVVQSRRNSFAHILAHCSGDEIKSMLEVGANVGINLRSLSDIADAKLFAVEPNAQARERLIADGVVPGEHAINGIAENLPVPDRFVDLVFTTGVLIHVGEQGIRTAIRELHRTSRRYVLMMEYFAPRSEMIPYRGQNDLLFRRDFGSLLLDEFSDVQPVAQGFLWRRTTAFDDLTWWLFRKP
jgi:spore coat polysaccharide biosynthesis protein SpsF